jgi:hypothetical protein
MSVVLSLLQTICKCVEVWLVVKVQAEDCSQPWIFQQIRVFWSMVDQRAFKYPLRRGPSLKE